MTTTNYKTDALALVRSEDEFRSQCVVVLEMLGQSCGVDVDLAKAREQLLRAERDLPGSWTMTWQDRLSEVGKELGLMMNFNPCTPTQAQSKANGGRLLVTLLPGEEELGDWIVLESGRQGLFEPGRDSTVRWISRKQLARRLEDSDGAGAAEMLTWVSAEPLLPCQPLQKPLTEEQEPHTPSPLRRLLSLLHQDKNDIWVVVIFSLGVGVFSLATPIAVEAIVGTIQGGTRILLQPVIALSIVLVVLLGLAALLRVFQAVVVEYLQQRIFVRVSIDLANRLSRVRMEALDRKHGPELVNRFFDVLTVQKASAILLMDGVSVVIQTIIGLTVLAFFNPYLLGFDIVLLGAIAFIIFVLGRGGIRTSITESYAKYGVAGWLEEMARNPLTFKMGGGRIYALSKANQLAATYVKARKAHFKILFRQILFALALQAVASAALFALGGWLVINRGLTLGQLVAAELILTMIVGSFIKLGKSLESFYDLLAGMDKLGNLIDLPLERATGERPLELQTPVSVSVENLSFAFQPNGRVPLFNGLNLTVAAGERVALVGPHGSGKSTLIDLLFGLRSPQNGRIKVDGIDIRDIAPEALRSVVSAIKGNEVFDGTVEENITVGRGISSAEIRKALATVRLVDEIHELPEGLKTRLSSGGAPLSFGQMRRLLLARAIVGKPRLILVDEVFDDLHEEIRDAVLEALLSPQAPWTLVAVTHSTEVAHRFDRQIRLDR